VLDRGEVHIGLCWGHLSEDHWEDLRVDGKIILKRGEWTRFICLRRWKSGGLL